LRHGASVGLAATGALYHWRALGQRRLQFDGTSVHRAPCRRCFAKSSC